MALEDLIRSLPENEQRRLEQAASTQRAVLSMYSLLHKQLRDSILRILSLHAQRVEISQFHREYILDMIRSEVVSFNSLLTALIYKLTDPIDRLVTKQVKRELEALGVTKRLPLEVDRTVIEETLGDASRNIVGWNSNIGNDFVRALSLRDETRSDVVKRISSLEGFKYAVHPVARARAHANVNVRYAVVYAANAARQDLYQQADRSLDLDIHKMWWSASGCCSNCATLRGQVVPLNEDFNWQSLTLSPWKGKLPHPPLHPQCRCRVIPVAGLTKAQLRSLTRSIA